MRKRMIDVLACPLCQRPLTLEAGSQDGEQIVQGALVCECGRRFPIVDAVPRLMVRDDDTTAFQELQERTRRSFGYQWTTFGDMVERFREDFLAYTGMSPEFFRGKVGLDAGCGLWFRLSLLQLLRLTALLLGRAFQLDRL